MSDPSFCCVTSAVTDKPSAPADHDEHRRNVAIAQPDSGEPDKRELPIVWRRLVKSGETCPRCGDTGSELEAAVAKLAAALRPLAIEPVLETQAIDEDAFAANPSESNRVWIAGRPVEEWLGADVGMSRCCSVCGDSDCRTLEVGGRTYETIPADLFIRAGLMAASQMMASASSSGRTATSCSGTTAASAPCPPAPERAKGGCGGT